MYPHQCECHLCGQALKAEVKEESKENTGENETLRKAVEAIFCLWAKDRQGSSV